MKMFPFNFFIFNFFLQILAVSWILTIITVVVSSSLLIYEQGEQKNIVGISMVV